MNTNSILIIFIGILIVGGIMYFFNDGSATSGEEHHASEEAESHEMYPGDVAEKIEREEDIILLDVRTPEEYEEVHLENAILLPVQKLSAQSLAEIGLGEDVKDKEIIIYCRSGARSKTAYDIMSSLGYTNLKSIAGGIVHWQEDQYPFTESGAYTGPSATVSNESVEDVEDAPRISIDRTFFDFGVVPQYGGVVQESFVVKNTGTKTLIIGDISTSCSCTSATISTSSIDPGQTADLTVIFDPDFHEEPAGVFKRTVFIPTNDPSSPEAEVVVQVDIAEGV